MGIKAAGTLAKSPQNVRPALPNASWDKGLAPCAPELELAAPKASADLSMAENTSLVPKSGRAAGATVRDMGQPGLAVAA